MSYYREEDCGVREAMLVRGYGDERAVLCWSDGDELVINEDVVMENGDAKAISDFTAKYELIDDSAWYRYFFGAEV